MATDNDTKNPQAEEPEVVEWTPQPLLQKAVVTSDGRILKGIDAEQAPFGCKEVTLLCLHSVDIPLPSEDPSILAQQCVRTVSHPIMGQVQQFAVSMDVGLAMLEVAHALRKRDDQIEKLEDEVAELRKLLAQDATPEDPEA